MHPFPTEITPNGRPGMPRLESIFAFFGSILLRPAAGAATPREGHAWCDALEHDLIDGVANYRWTRR
jgi:hypothetical protein